MFKILIVVDILFVFIDYYEGFKDIIFVFVSNILIKIVIINFWEVMCEV